jgi:hypothetical protein
MREAKHTKIGKNASEDKFLEAFKKFSASDWAPSTHKVRNLIEGALQAFNEGRPENIQTMLLNAKSVESRLDPFKYPYLVPSILLKLTEKSDEKLGVVNRALAKIPEADKESVLSNALKTAICKSVGEEPFFALLYEAGASFDIALSNMQALGADPDDINRLKFFQERIEGEPAAAEPIPSPTDETMPVLIDVMQQLLEQVAELTRRDLDLAGRVRELTEEVKSLKSAASPPASRKKTAQTNNPSL